MPSLAFLRENARWLAAGFLLALGSSFGQTFFIAIFSEPLRLVFNLSHGEFGTIYMVGTLLSAAFLVQLGQLADTMPARRLSLLLTVCLAAACLAMAMVSSWMILIAVVFSLRLFGQGLLSHLSQTTMARWCNATRGRALAIASFGYPTGEALVPLFNALRAAGAEIHYIFMPTSPIQGNSVYWAPIEKGLRAGRYLRAHVSDRAVPHITTATSIGKIDWNTSGWAVEQQADDPDYLWIRTPYTKDYYETFAPILQISDRVRHNTEGTLDALFRADIGDEGLYAGPRGLTSSPEASHYKLERTRELSEGFLSVLQASCLEDQRQLKPSIGGRPCPPLARQHLTRVELDCGAAEAELEAALAYVGAHREITDVVLSRRGDALTRLSTTAPIIERLIRIPHVIAVRIRSLKVIHAPGALSRAAVARLAGLNRLQVLRPTRLEVETQVLHSSELGPHQAQIVRALRQRGITVYNNTPMLGYINDNEEEMLRIADG